MSVGYRPSDIGTALTVHEAFGLRVACAFPLDELPEVGVVGSGDTDRSVDFAMTFDALDDLKRRFSGPADPPLVRTGQLGDGSCFRVERGRAGDYLVTYEDRATFHLSQACRTLRCAPVNLDAPEWRRFLLDTVLGIAALVQGFEALHAGAWLGPLGLTAVVAGTGGGKSTLVAEMIRRGRVLFCDDVLALSTSGERVVGHPGPPVMNLPPSLPDGTAGHRLGRVMASIDGECWTAIDRPAVGPAQVSLVVFLDRRPRVHPVAEALPETPAPLLAHSLRSGAEAVRLAARFELFATLARQARLVRVRVPLEMTPSAIADLIEGASRVRTEQRAS